jgi:hypothetical protein
MTDLAMMFQRFIFLWKLATSLTFEFWPQHRCSAKDTKSDEVVRRVPKKIGGLSRDSDLVQDLAGAMCQHRTFLSEVRIYRAYSRVRYLKTGEDNSCGVALSACAVGPEKSGTFVLRSMLMRDTCAFWE